MKSSVGESQIVVRLLNVCSVRNKTCIIRDLITDEKIDLFIFIETWLSQGDEAVIQEFMPETHYFVHLPRDGRAGGVGIAICNYIKVIKTVFHSFEYFECMEVHLSKGAESVAVYIIHRPPGYASLGFINEFELLLLQAQNYNTPKLYVGDFNIWIDDSSKTDTLNFTEALENYNLENHINLPTHRSGHTLDLILAESSQVIVEDFSVEQANTISDHMQVSFKLNLGRKIEGTKKVHYRNMRTSNYDNFDKVFSRIAHQLDPETCEHVEQRLKCL